MMTSTSLTDPLDGLGWTDDRARAFSARGGDGLVPGRVVSSGGTTIAITQSGATEVVIQRRYAREVVSSLDLPAIGDWLSLEPLYGSPPRAALREVLPRTGTFMRQDGESGERQVLAANLDFAFLVSGLDRDLNIRRIERYLLLALDGGVTPVVVLNKADLALDLPRVVAEVHAVAAGTRVIVTSAIEGTGIEELHAQLLAGSTACLLGSSGVGKSTIANALLGEERQSVRALREDDSRGRHTTTRRELFALPDGGLLIDTPGLRAVGVLGDGDALAGTFEEIKSFARGCRFNDCRHESEPGCAVRAAIENGSLDEDRLASHHKLEAELAWVKRKSDDRGRRAADRKLGRFFKQHKRYVKQRKGGDD
jgi:ribosome biogenesis GTPase / thiamine phosphate phosphatase